VVQRLLGSPNSRDRPPLNANGREIYILDLRVFVALKLNRRRISADS
jgi:hypothetical protein